MACITSKLFAISGHFLNSTLPIGLVFDFHGIDFLSIDFFFPGRFFRLDKPEELRIQSCGRHSASMCSHSLNQRRCCVADLR